MDDMVSLIVAGLFFSMGQPCVCRGGETAMRQTHRAFNRKPGEEMKRVDHGV